jgi:hypothetical protein
VIDGVRVRNLAQRLTGCRTLQGFAGLLLGQLRLAAGLFAFGQGAGAAFVGPPQDQIALKLGVVSAQGSPSDLKPARRGSSRPQPGCFAFDKAGMDESEKGKSGLTVPALI